MHIKPLRCDVCGEPITNDNFHVVDYLDIETFYICNPCHDDAQMEMQERGQDNGHNT